MSCSLFKVSLVAAVAIAASLTGRAEASPQFNPSALYGAADELSVVDNVHCRPGWRHHAPTRWRLQNGCRRAPGVVVVPGHTRYIVRDGVRVRVRDGGARTTIRSNDRTVIRNRTNINVQSGGDGGMRSDGGMRGGERRGGGEGKAGGSKQD